MESPEECPVCGAPIPKGSKACPECGADERTGWDDERTRYDGLDLPEEPDDRPSERRRTGPNGLPVFWWIVGLIVLAYLLRYTLLSWL